MSLFDEADLRARALSRLLHEQPELPARSDDDLNPLFPMIPAGTPWKPAAVLVPLVLRDSGTTVLLTRRREHLSKHAGQIAFPGGRIDGVEETAIDAALREASEEIGLAASFVEPLGFLKGYLTVTSYAVVPVISLVRPGFALKQHDDEVSEIFEVPLSFLMNPENHLKQHREFANLTRFYYAMPYGDYNIWGATAGMIRNMYEMMYA